MRAVSFIFIQGLIEDYNLGDSFSIVLRKLLQGSREARLFVTFGERICMVKYTFLVKDYCCSQRTYISS